MNFDYVLSNNIESKFGLEPLYDKFLIIAPEVKGNFGLEQTEFQSMISGEEISVAGKHKTARTVKWDVPIIMAGNQCPDYADNSGSIERRLILFEFAKAVKHANTQLGKLLYDEIPLLIQKGNRAYREAVELYGNNDLWDGILPQYFFGTRQQMQEQTNSLAAFLSSTYIEYVEDAVTPMRTLLDICNQFTRENNFARVKWTRENYASPFEKRGIDIVDAHPVSGEKGTYFVGIQIRQEHSVSLIHEDEAQDDLD